MKFLIFISLCVVCIVRSSAAFDDLLNKGTNLYRMVKELTSVRSGANTAQEIVAQMNNRDHEIGRLVRQIKEEVSGLTSTPDVSQSFAFVKQLLRSLPPNARVYRWQKNVESSIEFVDRAFHEFSVIGSEHRDAEFWETFAADHIELEFIMAQLRILLFAYPGEQYVRPGKLPWIVNETALLHSGHCMETANIQSFLGHFFEALIIRETQALAMITYATLVRYPESNAWNQILTSKVEDFRTRFEAYVEHFARYMDVAPKDLTTCNPPNGNWIRDESYFELENSQQIGKSNFVSVEPITTDVSRNMVVTGLRFVRKNGILYIQAKEGKLLANGWIDEDSQNWIALPEHPKLAAVTSTNNKFYLGDAILAANYVAIGVYFSENNGFSIGVTGRKFALSTGVLLSAAYDMVAQAGNYQQSTRTLFDGVSVEGNSPIAGIGMVHKSVNNYAGSISPRLFTIPYRQSLINFMDRNAGGRAFVATNSAQIS